MYEASVGEEYSVEIKGVLGDFVVAGELVRLYLSIRYGCVAQERGEVERRRHFDKGILPPNEGG